MWKVLRARGAVQVSDLVELAGVSADYAREYLRDLEKAGHVRRLSAPRGHEAGYRLVSTQVSAPVLTRNADKCRRLRAEKKPAGAPDTKTRARAALDAALRAQQEAARQLAEARKELDGITG
jgi:DNA-binding IscR family transcriptional regulator